MSKPGDDRHDPLVLRLYIVVAYSKAAKKVFCLGYQISYWAQCAPCFDGSCRFLRIV